MSGVFGTTASWEYSSDYTQKQIQKIKNRPKSMPTTFGNSYDINTQAFVKDMHNSKYKVKPLYCPKTIGISPFGFYVCIFLKFGIILYGLFFLGKQKRMTVTHQFLKQQYLLMAIQTKHNKF